MADNQSPDLNETGADATAGAPEPPGAIWPRTVRRPPVPVVPRMLPARGGDEPAPVPPSLAAPMPSAPTPADPLKSEAAVLPPGFEALARPPPEVLAPVQPKLAAEPQTPPHPILSSPWRTAPEPPAPPVPKTQGPQTRFDGRKLVRFARRAMTWASLAFAAWFVLTLGLIALYRFVNPPFSMLMLGQRLTGAEIDHTWVPLDAISPNLRRAVITSEDGKFCHHWGFDFGELKAAYNAGEGFGRGASTITQQVAKNMFLWPGKSYVRKALEVPITLVIEGLWPKRRIFEVYLNVAEWGPGVFGAEAASQHAYSHSAAQLSEREAALLAVALPNPIARDVSDPEPAVARLASRLQTRMRMPVTRGCVSTSVR